MSLNGTVWAPIGPSPMYDTAPSLNYNGLVTAIAVNPNNPSVLYLGTAGGGVWRSGDGGDNWTSLFDHQPTLGIGEPGGIAIDPNDTDTIYVGTNWSRGSLEASTIGQSTSSLSIPPTAMSFIWRLQMVCTGRPTAATTGRPPRGSPTRTPAP
jgi:hypothetical protein